MDFACRNKTGHFILTKINNRWWFCTPDGHVFISMSVAGVRPNGKHTLDCEGNDTYPIYNAKYGDANYNWGWNTLKRMKAWGFNSVGQDSVAFVTPTTTCSKCAWPGGRQPIPVPFLTEPKPSEYASVNYYGYLESPVKDEIVGTNGNYAGWRGGALFDAFDPNLGKEWQHELEHAKLLKSNNPYLLGVFTDDSDYFTGFGDGPDFVAGDTNANLGYITLITSPVQTFNHATWFQRKAFLYTPSIVYSKAQATNPKIPCSIQNPCSLRDYLWQKYDGNIAKLNSAWGSNYTTFDSSGTEVKREVIGVGDGTRKVFSKTVAHAPVSPYSVVVSVGDQPQGGDCPWFRGGCGTREASMGSIGSGAPKYVTQAESSINYSTGAVTVTLESAPHAGTPVTIAYIYHGWMSGGSGLMDESGSSAWVGKNAYCMEGPDRSFSQYFTCTGAGGNYKPKPSANAALGADVDNWISQFAAKYFKTMHDNFHAVSKVPYFGLDNFGQYTYGKVLQGAAPYLDGAFIGLFPWAQQRSLQPAEFQSAFQYFTKYIGDVPLLDFTIAVAQEDSSYSCRPHGPGSLPTQNARGEAWYNAVKYLLTTPSANGDYPFVGVDWWSWQDWQNMNQGLVSLHDNAYDGHEGQAGVVRCSPPTENLSCGGDTGNYGDAISSVKKANSVWLGLAK